MSCSERRTCAEALRGRPTALSAVNIRIAIKACELGEMSRIDRVKVYGMCRKKVGLSGGFAVSAPVFMFRGG